MLMWGKNLLCFQEGEKSAFWVGTTTRIGVWFPRPEEGKLRLEPDRWECIFVP